MDRGLEILTKNILDLNGKELQEEIDRIARENPPERQKWTEKEREIVRRLHAKGVPAKAIAKTLNRSIYSVYNLIERGA